jgi:hypothetical protein
VAVCETVGLSLRWFEPQHLVCCAKTLRRVWPAALRSALVLFRLAYLATAADELIVTSITHHQAGRVRSCCLLAEERQRLGQL